MSNSCATDALARQKSVQVADSLRQIRRTDRRLFAGKRFEEGRDRAAGNTFVEEETVAAENSFEAAGARRKQLLGRRRPSVRGGWRDRRLASAGFRRRCIGGAIKRQAGTQDIGAIGFVGVFMLGSYFASSCGQSCIKTSAASGWIPP